MEGILQMSVDPIVSDLCIALDLLKILYVRSVPVQTSHYLNVDPFVLLVLVSHFHET